MCKTLPHLGHYIALAAYQSHQMQLATLCVQSSLLLGYILNGCVRRPLSSSSKSLHSNSSDTV